MLSALHVTMFAYVLYSCVQQLFQSCLYGLFVLTLLLVNFVAIHSSYTFTPPLAHDFRF